MLMAPPGSDERRAAEALVQQALEAVARASKGLSLHLCTVSRPALAGLLEGPLRAAIHIPQARSSSWHVLITCCSLYISSWADTLETCSLPPRYQSAVERCDFWCAPRCTQQSWTSWQWLGLTCPACVP